MNADWNKDYLRGTPSKDRSGLSYKADKSERCTPEQEKINNARIKRENRAIEKSVPTSDYEYFDRMARELENENLEGAA